MVVLPIKRYKTRGVMADEMNVSEHVIEETDECGFN